jgi:hypothetical protein
MIPSSSGPGPRPFTPVIAGSNPAGITEETEMKCPGQDTRYWKSDDIFEIVCPHCQARVEFFKDDNSRKCQCGERIFNPKIKTDCFQYCEFAENCKELLGK